MSNLRTLFWLIYEDNLTNINFSHALKGPVSFNDDFVLFITFVFAGGNQLFYPKKSFLCLHSAALCSLTMTTHKFKQDIPFK